MPDSNTRQHRNARAIAIANMVDGTLCPYCHCAMTKLMHLDYDHVVPIVFGGIDGPMRLSHAHCNRSAGAVMGNRLRNSSSYINKPKVLRPRGGTSGRAVPISRKLPKW